MSSTLGKINENQENDQAATENAAIDKYLEKERDYMQRLVDKGKMSKEKMQKALEGRKKHLKERKNEKMFKRLTDLVFKKKK